MWISKNYVKLQNVALDGHLYDFHSLFNDAVAEWYTRPVSKSNPFFPLSVRISHCIFWSNSPFTQSTLDLHTASLSTQLYVLFKKKKKESNLYHSDTLECGVAPPAAISLKKTNAPSPSSYQLPIGPQLGVGLHEHLLALCWAFLWLALA